MILAVAVLAVTLVAQERSAGPGLGATASPAADSVAARDGWFGADKLKHFFVAAFTQSVAYSALQATRVRHDQALAGAWAVTAVASVAKELHDRRTTGLFSVRDLVWDAAGAGAASIILTSARRSGSRSDFPPSRSGAQASFAAGHGR